MTEDELMKEAGTPVTYSDVYYGKCLLSFWEGKFPRNEEGRIIGKPVRWYEGDDPKQRLIMIDLMLDLCPGCTSNYQIKLSCPKHDKDWQKIVLPSLAECGAGDAAGNVDFSKVKNHWAKLQQVEGTRPRDKDNPDKGCWNTYKFLALYNTERECLDAMALDNGEDITPGVGGGQPVNKDAEKRKAALEFCKVAIAGYKGMSYEDAKQMAEMFISKQANIAPYVSVDDEEIRQMLMDATIPF